MPAKGPPSAPSIFPGATISGRFRLVRLLGRGSTGSVWLARHLTLDVDVAVKFIEAASREQKDHRTRFALEAQAATRINSPHVVNILDFGAEASGRLFIATEHLRGEDLGKWLERSGRLSPATTARIVSHACRGLGRAHALGIAHRDVKPKNLFLVGAPDNEAFVLKVLDFGVAQSAPDLDFHSDLFALAAIAYHCLTGATPFPDSSRKEPVPATQRAPELPRAIDDWFQRALDKNPARRFASAKELAQAFHLAIGQNASSSVDYASSSTMAVAAPVAPPDAPSAPVVGADGAQQPSARRADVSNHTASAGVPLALAQVAEVSNVLGIALVGPEGDLVAHHSSVGLPASIFADVMRRARDSLEPFESVDSTYNQALALYFESATLLIRWVENYAVIVIGTQQVHPTVLSVSLNAAASKLQALAKQAGGVAIAFRSTISSLPEYEFFEIPR